MRNYKAVRAQRRGIPFSSINDFIFQWKENWRDNKSKIWKLSLINLSLTFFSELMIREALGSFMGGDISPLLFAGGMSVQGLINCVYTFLISLLGVPLLFFKGLKGRYICFLFFGISVSAIAQVFANSVLKGGAAIEVSRLCFDVAYLSTIKFMSFEFFRPAFIRNDKVHFLFGLRLGQDLLQTLFKTICLISIGLTN